MAKTTGVALIRFHFQIYQDCSSVFNISNNMKNIQLKCMLFCKYYSALFSFPLIYNMASFRSVLILVANAMPIICNEDFWSWDNHTRLFNWWQINSAKNNFLKIHWKTPALESLLDKEQLLLNPVFFGDISLWQLTSS